MAAEVLRKLSAGKEMPETYSTVPASAGVPLKTVQKMLGHSDVRITVGIYRHRKRRP
ncbi:tyrosine-type recombinase/integrase [Rhodocaloribacter sp.]